MSEDTRVVREPVSFRLADGTLTIRDEAGGGELVAEIEGESSLAPASESWFDVPVDGAVGLETESLRFRNTTSVTLRDAEGEFHGALTGEPFSLDADGCFVAIDAVVHVLVYVERGGVSGRLVGSDPDEFDTVALEFDGPTRLVLGARSYHEEPAATLTVPDDPEALMTAASHLGSGIKEWTAERSWPTLRGHPPAIESGDELHIPAELSRPETGVTVAVPADTASVLRVTPLAHYLGAEVVPGERAELRFAGHAEPLGRDEPLERSVDRLLSRCLLLDSLVRIGGYYSVPRHEYEALAPELPFYPPELYDEPLPQQLLEYLEVPFETLERFAPRWPVTGVLEPTVESAQAVPYLLDRLAPIHVVTDGSSAPRSADGTTLTTLSTVPPGVASLPAAARRRAADYERHESGESEALLVGWAPSAPGPFERRRWDHHDLDGVPAIDHRETVTTAALRDALAAEPTYVYYGGEVTPEGFVCTDGVLPFDALSEPNVGAVSVRPGDADVRELTGLLRAATVACLHEQPLDREAAERFASYLALGASVAQSAALSGVVDRTRFVGDASLSLTSDSGGSAPFVYRVERVDADSYRLSVSFTSNSADGPGTVVQVYSAEFHDEFQLAGTRFEAHSLLSTEELVELGSSDAVFLFDEAPPEAFPREWVAIAPDSIADVAPVRQ